MNNRKYENLVKFKYLGERTRKNFKTSGNKQKKENNGYLEIKLEAGRGDRDKIFLFFYVQKVTRPVTRGQNIKKIR